MRALLDVNFLIALMDEDHIFNQKAVTWFKSNKNGWSSCPLSQNAFVRISSNPRYTGSIRYSVADSITQLGTLVDNSDHEFWPDDISILDSTHFDPKFIHGPKQLTDLYLLALATKLKGCLVTFDTGIPLSAVRGAQTANLIVL